jgi:hypothetical protein
MGMSRARADSESVGPAADFLSRLSAVQMKSDPIDKIAEDFSSSGVKQIPYVGDPLRMFRAIPDSPDTSRL